MILIDFEKQIIMIRHMDGYNRYNFVFNDYKCSYFRFDEVNAIWFGDLNNDFSKLKKDDLPELVPVTVKVSSKICNNELTFYNHITKDDYEQYKNDVVIIDIFNKTKGAI